MHYLMLRLFTYMICSRRPNLSIINIGLGMKWNMIELMLNSPKIREIVSVLSIKNGQDKKSLKLISPLTMI